MQIRPPKPSTFILSAGNILEKDKNHSYLSLPRLQKFPLKRIREEVKSKTCFVDDITVISPSILAHSSALQEFDQRASSLDFVLKLEKCISLLFDGKDLVKHSTLPLSHGSTHNISEAPWKVVGHLFAISTTCSLKASATKLESKLQSARTSTAGQSEGNSKFGSSRTT